MGAGVVESWGTFKLITIIFGRAAQFLLALAMMRVATTLLSPEEMGKVSLVSTTTAFFAFFFISPIGMFINRRLHAWRESGVARHYFLYYVNYLLSVSLVAAVFLYLLQLYGWINSGMPVVWLVALVCGSILFSTITLTAIPSLNLLGEANKFVGLSVAMAAASFVCAVLIVYMNHPLAQYWLMGQLIGQTLIGVIGVKLLLWHLQNSLEMQMPLGIQKRHLRTLLRFAWPVAIAAGLGWVQAQGYRYIMESQLGLMQLGLFVAGYGISAGLISGFESILTTYYQPRLYRDVSSGSAVEQVKAWQLYASSVIPSLMLTVAFIMMLAPELTRLFLGERFQSAADYLIWGGLAEAARVLIGVYSLIAHVFMRTSWLIIPNIIGAALSIILCALLIPEYGAAGAGIGLLSSGFTVVLAMHVLLAGHVAGGFSIRSTLNACIFAAVLWGGTIGVRQLLSEAGHWSHLILIALISIPYLVWQYFFLRNRVSDTPALAK